MGEQYCERKAEIGRGSTDSRAATGFSFVLLCFVKPILANRYGPGVIPLMSDVLY